MGRLLFLLIVLGLGFVVVRQLLPDLQRYLRLEAM
jgi:hypothetical protein